MRARRPGIAFLLALLSTSACALTEQERRPKTDALAQAFARYVFCHYTARLAVERSEPGPSAAARARAREDLARALGELGVDLPEEPGEAGLHAGVEAMRKALTAEDYVFLPLSQTGETEDADLGIALARVSARDPARSQELWGKKIEYKRILYEPFVDDYPGWRAHMLNQKGPVYRPGRFAGTTVYIDRQLTGELARNLRASYKELGFDGVVREVELRQAAFLLFMKDIPSSQAADPATLERVCERVLWTACRYGEPDAAFADVSGLAADQTGAAPRALHDAAVRIRARLPDLSELTTKKARADALQRAAEDAWQRLGG